MQFSFQVCLFFNNTFKYTFYRKRVYPSCSHYYSPSLLPIVTDSSMLMMTRAHRFLRLLDGETLFCTNSNENCFYTLLHVISLTWLEPFICNISFFCQMNRNFKTNFNWEILLISYHQITPWQSITWSSSLTLPVITTFLSRINSYLIYSCISTIRTSWKLTQWKLPFKIF